MRVPIERLCRLNGNEPTPRERWRAFYSLYRSVQRLPFMSQNELGDALRIIADNQWVAMLNQCDPLENKPPPFLRKWIVDMEIGIRKRRNTERLLAAIMRPVEET